MPASAHGQIQKAQLDGRGKGFEAPRPRVRESEGVVIRDARGAKPRRRRRRGWLGMGAVSVGYSLYPVEVVLYYSYL